MLRDTTVAKESSVREPPSERTDSVRAEASLFQGEVKATMPAAILSDSFLSASSAVISTAWKRLRVEAQPRSAQFCVLLRGLRACAPYREA